MVSRKTVKPRVYNSGPEERAFMLTRLLLITCLLTSSAFARDKSADAPNKDLAQKVMDAWATLDTSKPAPYYAKDGDNVYFDLLPLKYNGWDEYSKGVTKVFE